MYLLGYTLDNLSLMALTISTGFVVDDAIVVIENITRHLEEGMQPLRRRHGRLQGDRLHRPLHVHLARRRLHSHPAHGRHRRPSLPRVRRHALRRHRRLAGRLAHHHAHARGQVPQAHRSRQKGLVLPPRREAPQAPRRRVRARSPLGHPPPGHHALHLCHHLRAQHLPLHHRAQGLLPPAGHRPPRRHAPDPAGHLLQSTRATP